MTTTDMVLASDVAALDRLEPQHREIAVTAILQQSHDWLARAQEATDPARQVSEFKAFIATVAETSKQLKLSKEIQQDSQVMVRRAERALGLAIRKGQTEGQISDRGSRNNYGGPNHRQSRDSTLSSPDEFLPTGSDRAMTYAVTDDVSDDEFEEALERAQDERNVSRANVVRKIQNIKTHSEVRAEQWEEVAALAEKRLTSDQINSKLKMYSEAGTLRKYAKDRGIEFPADKFVGRGSHKFNTRRALESIVSEMHATAMAYPLMDLTDISPEEAEQMLERADEGFKSLKKIMTQLKEIAR